MDDKTLVCESCGYCLAGLPVDGACPECGLGVRESLPERRFGSAWQRGERWGWWKTAEFIFGSRAGFRVIFIERRRSVFLVLWTTLAAAVLGASVWLALAAHVAIWSPGGGWREVAIWWPVAVAGLWVLMLAGSWIESVGIRFFGRRRGWRVTGDVAAAVCGHASFGWIGGGVVAAGASLLGFVLDLPDGDGTTVGLVGGIGLPLGAVIGLLWFEILVYIGVRACRFANPPDATGAMPEGRASQPLGDASVSSCDVGAGVPTPHAYDASTRLGKPAGPTDEPARRADTSPDSMSTPP